MTDTPRDVPYVLGPAQASEPEPASWMPGAVPPKGPGRKQDTSTRTALFVGLGSGLAVVLVAAAVAVGIYLRQNGDSPMAASGAPAAVTAPPSATATKTVGPGTFAITGTITLTTGFTGATTCAGKGGFQDIHGGAQVSVLDGSGAVVALGQLLPGTVEATGCVFLFGVPDVPGGKGFYEVTVSHRGGVRYLEDELATRTIDLSLGA